MTTARNPRPLGRGGCQYRSGQGTPEGARESALYITENLERDGFVLRQVPVVAWPRSLIEGPFSVLASLVLLGSAPNEDWAALWEATLHFGVPLEAGAFSAVV